MTYNANEFNASLMPNYLHLGLFPTEQCNFRCVYCYEDFVIGKMPRWLIEAIKTLLQHRVPELDVLRLGWFGGEPLMAKRIVFEIAELANKLAGHHGCYITGNTATNGSLLDVETLTKLVALNQNEFQISIDGDRETHDTTRLTRKGGGSFDNIWQRLLDAAETNLGFKMTLRIHVTALNQESVHKFCDRYAAELGEDKRFSLFFKAIESLGGGDKVEATVQTLRSFENPERVAAALQSKYQPLLEVGSEICYAAKPNSLLIRANGHLNKCTVSLKSDMNDIGKINPDGTLQINNKKFASWIQGFKSLDKWQMSCPNSYLEHQSMIASSGDIELVHVG